MKSNFPEDVENPKRAQLQKQFKALEKMPWGGRERLQVLRSPERGRGWNSNAAKEGQSRGAQAARVMLILPQALQGRSGWVWTSIPSR